MKKRRRKGDKDKDKDNQDDHNSQDKEGPDRDPDYKPYTGKLAQDLILSSPSSSSLG